MPVGIRDASLSRKHSAFTRRGAIAPGGMAIAIPQAHDAVNNHEGHEGIQNVNARVRDVIVSGMAVLMLLALLFALDQRVRERVTHVGPTTVSRTVARSAGRVIDAGTIVTGAVTDHVMLTIFVVAGTILVACMLRT